LRVKFFQTDSKGTDASAANATEPALADAVPDWDALAQLEPAHLFDQQLQCNLSRRPALRAALKPLRAPHRQRGNPRPPQADRTSGPRIFPRRPPCAPQRALPERFFDGSVPFIPAMGRLDFLSLYLNEKSSVLLENLAGLPMLEWQQ
jgi:hypothetical protein